MRADEADSDIQVSTVVILLNASHGNIKVKPYCSKACEKRTNVGFHDKILICFCIMSTCHMKKKKKKATDKTVN